MQDSAPGRHDDNMIVLKLQAPPKPRYKRQVSSDPTAPEPEIARPDQMIPPITGPCWNFSNSPTDRTQCMSSCDYVHTQQVESRLQHSSPKSSFSSNFSPKKFRSQFGPIPSPSYKQAGVDFIRNDSRIQKSIDSFSRCGLESFLADTHTTSGHVPLIGNTSKKTARVEQTEIDASFIRPKTGCLNMSNALAQSPCCRKSNVIIESAGSNLRKAEYSPGGMIQTNKPDIFVFPDCVTTSVDSEDAAGVSHEIDEPDGLDSPMDTDDFSFRSSHRLATAMDNGFPKFRSHDLVSSPSPRSNYDYSTVHSSISQSHFWNTDRKFTHFMAPTGETHRQQVYSDVRFEQNIMKTTRTMSQNKGNPPGDLHSHGAFQEHREYRTQDLREATSARAANSCVTEVLDISVSDDVTQYLADAESVSQEQASHSRGFVRKSNANDNRMARKDREDVIQAVKTTADTNVCYVSMYNINSSASSDDMDDDFEDDDITECGSYASYVNGFGDEPDGKNKKHFPGREMVRMSKGQTGKSSGVTHAGLVLQECEDIPESSCLREEATHQEHPQVGFPGQSPPIRINNGCLSNQVMVKITDGHLSITMPPDHASSSQSSEIDDWRQVTLLGQVHQQKHHRRPQYHQHHHRDLNCNKNVRASFPNLAQPEVRDTGRLLEEVRPMHVTHTDNKKLDQRVNKNQANNFIRKSQQFADEVDGLGDTKKKNTNKGNTDSATNSRDNVEENVIHCFDKSETGSETPKQSQPNTGNLAGVAGGSRDGESRGTSQSRNETALGGCSTNQETGISEADRNVQKQKHLERHTGDTKVRGGTEHEEMYTRQMLANIPCEKLPDADQSPAIASQKNIGKPEEKQFRLYRESGDMFCTEMLTNISSQKLPDTGQSFAIVYQNVDPRLRRRKSDTSVRQVTVTGLFRTQSSPSKLGLTEEAISDNRQVIFHRPWLDQRIHPQNIVVPGKSTVSDFSGGCLKTFSGRLENMPGPSIDAVWGFQDNDGPAVNKETFSSQRLQGNMQQSDTDLSSPSGALQPWISTKTNMPTHYHSSKQTTIKPKRKLEFPVHDSESHQLPPKKQTSGVVSCPSHLNRRDLGAGQRECVLDEATTSSDQRMYTTSGLQEGGSASSSLSRSDGEEVRAPARGQDEVDVRIQIMDVFQESTRLLQRLESIYQAGERSCECSRIEHSILKAALDMFRTLGNEASSRENWTGQLQQTNEVIKKTLDLAENFRRLCRHSRQVTDVFSGSVCIRVKCHSYISFIDLWDMHATGELHQVLWNILSHSVACDTPGITLRVTLERDSVVTCRRYLLGMLHMQMRSSSQTGSTSQKQVAPLRGEVLSVDNLEHVASDLVSPCGSVTGLCRSPTPSDSPRPSTYLSNSLRERTFSFGEFNRTAFQELNISDVTSPTSPSFCRLIKEDTCQIVRKTDQMFTAVGRLNSPNILSSPNLLTSPGPSPLTSPRRPNFSDIVSERENIGHGD